MRCGRAGSRARWRIASLWASSALALAAGCGGAERSAIPAATAGSLARQSDGVAAALERGDRCTADRLADALLRASSAAPMPSDYRSPLVDAARSLAARISCPPPAERPAARGQPDERDDHGNDENHGKHRGQGKGRRG
jgi:hypothetical protein